MSDTVVGALIGSGVTVALELSRLLLLRKKPRRIVFEEINKDPELVTFPSNSPIGVTINNLPVTKPSKVTWKVHNESSEPIKPDSFIQVRFPKATPIYVSIVPQSANFQAVKNQRDVLLKIEYLNPSKEHKDIYQLEVICDGKPEYEIVGSGIGWSTRTTRKVPSFVYFSLGMLAVLLLGAVSTGILLVKTTHGVNNWAASIAALTAGFVCATIVLRHAPFELKIKK